MLHYSSLNWRNLESVKAVRIYRPDQLTIAIDIPDALCLELLLQIPPSAKYDDCESARKRLFPEPIGEAKLGSVEAVISQDWEDFVVPDLEALFQTAIETVQSDLNGIDMTDAQEECVLRIPVSHLEAWLHALNQARIALAARHGLAYEDPEEGTLIGERAVAFSQMQVYGEIQAVLIKIMEQQRRQNRKR